MIFKKKPEPKKVMKNIELKLGKVEEVNKNRPPVNYPIKGTFYFSELNYQRNEKAVVEKLDKRVSILDKEKIIHVIEIKKDGEFYYDDTHPHNKSLPDDAPDEQLIFRRDYYAYIEFQNLPDYIQMVMNHSPNFAEITNGDNILIDVHQLNSFVGLILDTNMKLALENQKMREVLLEKHPELFERNGVPLPKKVVKKKSTKKKAVKKKKVEKK